jgi:signal transduction histidine kinase
MARVLNTLLARLVLAALAIHAVLAPLLYVLVMRIVNQNEIELFVNDVRAYSRFLADIVELETSRMSEGELAALLDSVVLSQETIYAELRGPARTVRSSLLDDTAMQYAEDFAFGEHDDSTYFLSVPLNGPRSEGMVLYLGFDERPTSESLLHARNQVLLTLLLFVGLSLMLVVTLGLLLIRPLKSLRQASQRVASGRYEEHLGVSSRIAEVSELAQDLERMRGKLVGINQRLSSEVAERLQAEEERADLERKLRHVQKLETVGTLAGGIAHEFNNLLVPIKFYTELAVEDLPAENRIRADMERVLAAVGRAKNLVQQILTFSRQSQQEHFAVVELGRIVEDALQFARDLFPSTIRIEQRIDMHSSTVRADVTQIHQLIMNLLSNAYQALASAGGTITISVAPVEITAQNIPARTNLVPGRYVELSVSDTGHGIEPLMIERVFEPFFTTRPPGEGTGLGLSVAHGIALSHQGAITVRSQTGVGSTFSVYLPLADAHAAHETSPLAQGRYRIICIATADCMREDCAELEALGAEVAIVADRHELARALAAHANADLVILDVCRGRLWQELEPGDVAREFIESGRLLVIAPLNTMLTGNDLDLAPAHHLVTPLDVRVLRDTVRHLMESQSAVSAGGAE